MARAPQYAISSYLMVFAFPTLSIAQQDGSNAENPRPPTDDASAAADQSPALPTLFGLPAGDNTEHWGSVEPGAGFRVANTERGVLDISGYVLFRYLDQRPADQSFIDHLGREHDIDTRRDLQLHRLQIFFKGWLFDPKFRYVANIWTVNSTGQVAVVGSLAYDFNRAISLHAGVNGIPGTRSLGGSHPYWLAHDRVMADEFFRPGFTSGIWITGEPVENFHYTAMIGTNLSELGISAGEDTRDLAYGATVWWMPTTGEFGSRGGFGDFEHHEEFATRFGMSAASSREDRASQLSQRSPDNTSIRLSDSLNLFEAEALAPGVTVQTADYELFSIDAGMKYRGWFVAAELYRRKVDRLVADGPLPIATIEDSGYYLQASYMLVPKKWEVYVATSKVNGEFNDSDEVLVGGNWYPFADRNMRVNAQIIDIDRSPVNSSFGFYVGGQVGKTYSIAASYLF